jgi:branched-chain amino acid transport system permease protein
MDPSFYLIQILNGVQYGFLLFLVASGLTLVFGVMGVINLAHGSFFMIGAYLVYWLEGVTGSIFAALALAVPLSVLVGLAVEQAAVRFLYRREHLDQVLLTYGLILIFNEAQRTIWGSDVHSVAPPDALAGSLTLTAEQAYPAYRLFITAVCLGVGLGLYGVIRFTRVGMRVRAAAENPDMTQALGIDSDRLFTVVFVAGAALAAFSGMIAAPVEAVYPGMGERVLIVSFVVVVVGGIGSIRGAFVGAMLIGLADAFGKALAPELSGAMIYAVMAAVLVWRPQGLFQRGVI